MTKSAWKAYKQFAMGKEGLAPLTNGSFGGNTGKSIIAALSTLKVMGLEEEFTEGRQWLAGNWKFESLNGTYRDRSFFNQISEFMGGFLSAYALTGDQLFLDEATEIVAATEPVFNTTTGLPMEEFNSKTKVADDDVPPLKTAGGTFLEFAYYAKATGRQQVVARARQNRRYLREHRSADGLYGIGVNVNLAASEKQFEKNAQFGLDWNSNAFYRALLLSAIQSNGSDSEGLAMYSEAVEALIEKGYIISYRNGTVAIPFRRSQQSFRDEFVNLVDNCNLGGLMALEAETLKAANYSAEIVDRHRQLGLRIGEDCYKAANNTLTKLPPHMFLAVYHLPERLSEAKYWLS